MKNHICLEIKFGVGGNAPEYQLDGWSHPEVGMTWAVGKRSRLCLPRPSGKFGCVLEIEATAFTPGDTLVSQCITLFVDGEKVGRESFHGRRRMSFCLPTDEGRPSEMIVEIHHPDASRPTDFSDSPDIRELSIMIAFMRLITIDEAWGLPECRNSMIRMKSDAISPEEWTPIARAITGMGIDELAACFEPFIGNCEFGFFQRHCGSEPLSLLRFAAGRIELILPGIESGFDKIGEPEDLRLQPNEREWFVNETSYGLYYHTFVRPGEVPYEAMLTRESKRLKFLARKLREDMSEGRKVFLCNPRRDLPYSEMLSLSLALNRRGPCKCLFISASADDAVFGKVEFILPRVMRGYIDHVAPFKDPSDFSFVGWLNVCVNALLLSKSID